MIRTTKTTLTRTRHIRRFYSSQHALPSVQTITGPLDLINVDEFRAKAFIPEKPLHIKSRDDSKKNNVNSIPHSIPAAGKWFDYKPSDNGNQSLDTTGRVVLSQKYLTPFGNTILPYELIAPPKSSNPVANHELSHHLLNQILQHSEDTTFHRFSAPLSLFLHGSTTPTPPSLYIAQAQLLSLPSALQADLPTPHLVLSAGKGDIYDANLWMGIPPTYTPLHKDPNPNLFVQLASQKRVRLFGPSSGGAIYKEVQGRIGRAGFGGAIRGNEMMEGPEREELLEAVWGEAVKGREEKGFEAVVGPGDALFIPKGWWHSFMSVGKDVNASVNWWFR